MIIKSAEFLTSAVKPSQYPEEGLPEIAFAGRSNVGKSSLINLLLGRKSLAKVSSSPGKTRTINFFLINNGEFRLVDLPGYGYAKVSKSVSEDWGKMMETFLTKRKGLIKVIQLVDARHEPSAQDRQMYDFLQYYGLDGLVVATKADKLSKNELSRNLAAIRKSLDMEKDDILIATSSLSKTGIQELLDNIEKILEGYQENLEND
ncbi:MAG: YihA family ribosome biogenesis GTP-binding protein [Firmicutes bacterium]|nr:YihA family ribosome biogenesis GTP-binding protein [Bacillota bacterium]